MTIQNEGLFSTCFSLSISLVHYARVRARSHSHSKAHTWNNLLAQVQASVVNSSTQEAFITNSLQHTWVCQ